MPDQDIDDMPDVPLNLDGNFETEAETSDVQPTENVAPTEEVPADKPEETAETTETTTEGQQQPDESQETEQGKQETDEQAAQREQNARYAAQRVQQRAQTQREIANRLDETYGPKSEQVLYDENIAKGMSEELAAVRAESQALREQMTYSAQRAEISELNAGMQAEAVNVQYDFPIYRELNTDGSKNPDYDPDFAKLVQEGYQRRAGVEVDEATGVVLKANESLYDYYKEMYDIRSLGTAKAAESGQAAAMQMMSRTEEPAGGSQGRRGTETLEELGERLADVPIY